MIPKSFDDAFSQVKSLADRFSANEAAYLSPKYQEAEVRQDFLDKFFVALGWDVFHQEHPNPYEREVKIEKSVMVGDRGKKADYAFYTAPNFLQARFMAEAKKPARQLENPYDCFQAMRYGWNANTPLAVLTDFEQFLVLDARYKPSVEKAASGIIEKFHYTQFLDEESFRRIYYLFSRESVGDGSLEKFIQSRKKGKTAKAAKVAPAVQMQPVGDTFLTELDAHRAELARGFKRGNPELDGDELTEITQRTLDRLVFIRFLEDKLVEPSEIIDRLGAKSGSKWRDFVNEVPRLNSIYNGIIFKPHAILDASDFQPDERAFSDTLKWLSHKDSPYDFNTIPIHILGSIYERFLGKTIVVTEKRAAVEEKPEVRKAGGVYYTPEYIVRYIVENTIGKLLVRVTPGTSPVSSPDKKSPKGDTLTAATPDEIAKMRFADIACGSGSFLLGIFDYLIKYHVDWYSGGVSAFGVPTSVGSSPGIGPAKAGTPNAKRRADAIKAGLCRETSDGSLQLTLGHKRDILLNNIYGVDLDAQAVEVAQLSLYLKLLEEETTATAQQYLAGFREQLLPSLHKNIVHGNSLIDYDVMDGQLFDARDLKKLNPMSFPSTFPEVFKSHSVGSPRDSIPRVSSPRVSSPRVSSPHVSKGHVAHTDLRATETGGFDAIVGNPPYGADFSEIVKGYLNRKYRAQTYQLDSYLLFLERSLADLVKINGFWGMIIPNPWLTNLQQTRIRKFVVEETSVREIVHFKFKVFPKVTVDTQVVVLQNSKSCNSTVKISVVNSQEQFLDPNPVFLEIFHDQDDWKERHGDVINIFLSGEEKELIAKITENSDNLAHYFTINVGIKPYQTGKGTPKQSKQIVKDRPFDSDFKETEFHRLYLRGRDIGRYLIAPLQQRYLKFGVWLAEHRPAAKFDAPEKLFMRQTGDSLVGCYDNSQYLSLNNMHVLVPNDGAFSIKFFLGLVNSRLLNWFHQSNNPEVGEALAEVKREHIAKLPIRTIDFNNPTEKAMHDRMVDLVEKMLEGKKSAARARTDSDRAFYERFCTSLDNQIDELVYQLYDITAEERRIIEGR